MTLLHLKENIADRYFVRGARVAVALSGGADSVFLLHLLSRKAKEIGFELYALHVNHMIRGEEADRDENFCREVCKGLGVGFFCERRNVPLEAEKSGKTLEEAARDARYSSFEKIMRRESIPVIATAHNADDLAENILIRLLRGTSLDGICGIPEERDLAYGRVVRPILSVSKREILKYCEDNKIPYVTDSTNLCDDYTRNKIRHGIIPMLSEITPAFLEIMGRNAELFLRDSEFLTREADRLLSESVTDGVLALDALRDTPPAILSRIVNRFCIVHGARPEREHVERLTRAISDRTDTSLSLPGGVRAVILGDTLRILPDIREKRTVKDYRFALALGENYFEMPECGLSVKAVLRAVDGDDELIFGEEKYSLRQSLIYNLATHKLLKFDTINDGLFLRNRRSGDTIDFGTFRKPIKKLMNEKKIPADIRDVLPCLEKGGEIVYVPFAAEAKKCHVGAEDEKQGLYILELYFKFNMTEE